MNPYKLNGVAGHYFRQAVCEGLNTTHSEIYKEIKDISYDGVITTKKGEEFKLKLEKV